MSAKTWMFFWVAFWLLAVILWLTTAHLRKYGKAVIPLMSAKIRMVFLVIFWLLAISSWLVTEYLTRLESYELVALVLGIISSCFGVWILLTSRFSWRLVLLVVIGLAIGQWWQIAQFVIFVGWSINGFAP